ncbi:MAG TPA: tRNA (adenosine(37)-N6)-threonylcarbamoyltransferase complex dimerization subunit type 1 TsaB [Solirubrobacterales bacterium]|nr:tRNA (adenosine(37)-N6)-threonylcarbamoyltransferase complex dimerization subunit type 1 TsaB [Solirubrobacterales bacterium]
MFVLGVDTATDYAVVGVTADGETAHEVAIPPGPDGRPRHSQVLLSEIERAVDAAGGWSRIERVAVGIGPGSFTGLRIGIATARALAQAREVPLAPVGSLSALGRGISESLGPDTERALPVFDARRNEAFAALFTAGNDERWPPFVAPPEELAGRVRELDETALAAGDGALRFAAELEAAGATVAPPEDPIHRVAARHVCAVGEAATEAPTDQIQPLYLRPPDAKRWRERDRGVPRG